jgi:hypothetical protein
MSVSLSWVEAMGSSRNAAGESIPKEKQKAHLFGETRERWAFESATAWTSSWVPALLAAFSLRL